MSLLARRLGMMDRALSTTPYYDEVMADSPIAYWRLAESSGTSAADESGNSRTGTYVGSPTLGAASSNGDTGDTAVTFNASTQYASLTTLGGKTLGGANALTVELWFKASASDPADMFFGMLDATSGLTVQGYWGTSGPTQYPRFDLTVGGKSKNVFGAVAPATLKNGAWHHLACVYYDASTAMDMYLDGSLSVLTRTINEVTSGTAAIPRPIYLNARNNGGTADLFWGATLDEVAIYDSALSASRIAAHYAAA